jgi:hypothetical protein
MHVSDMKAVSGPCIWLFSGVVDAINAVGCLSTIDPNQSMVVAVVCVCVMDQTATYRVSCMQDRSVSLDKQVEMQTAASEAQASMSRWKFHNISRIV